MRQQSYFKTIEQFLARRKDITRRRKCSFSPGEHYQAVNRMQGLKKGQKRVVLGECECLANVPERVTKIIKHPVRKCVTEEEFNSASKCCWFFSMGFECINPMRPMYLKMCILNACPGIHEVDREGFPELTPVEFAGMFCKMNHLLYTDIIQRVVFRRIS